MSHDLLKHVTWKGTKENSEKETTSGKRAIEKLQNIEQLIGKTLIERQFTYNLDIYKVSLQNITRNA